VLSELTSDLFYPYEPYSWDLRSQRLGYITCLFASGFTLIPLDVSNIVFILRVMSKDSLNPFWLHWK